MDESFAECKVCSVHRKGKKVKERGAWQERSRRKKMRERAHKQNEHTTLRALRSKKELLRNYLRSCGRSKYTLVYYSFFHLRIRTA